MRLPLLLTALAAGAAIVGFAAVLALQPAAAGDEPQAGRQCQCPDPGRPSNLSTAPRQPSPTAGLDENDEIAALEAIRVALTEVGDGSTYVWRRRHGRLSGIVQPTTSFKDAGGRVCRHILLIMTVGTATGRAEGIACRLADGRWQLDG
jgi:surface antigen